MLLLILMFLLKIMIFFRVIKLFEHEGLAFEKHPGKQSFKQINFLRNDLLKIDLHNGFHWQGNTFFDERLVWKNTRFVSMLGVKIQIPALFVEVLLNLAHILYERRYVTLLDYFFLKDAIKKVDIDNLLKQANKYAWDNSLSDLLGIFNFLSSNFNNIKFPYILPLSLCIKTFNERYIKIGYFPKYDFAYFIFTTLRYYFTNRKRMPYYSHWFNHGN